MIKRNLPYKLLALTVAIIVWVYVRQAQSPNYAPSAEDFKSSKKFNVLLEVRGINNNMVASVPKQVTVTVEGRQEDVQALAASQDEISAYVDAHNLGVGRHKLPVIVYLPEESIRSLRKSISPKVVEIILEKKIKKDFAIQAIFTEDLPNNYTLAEPEILPDKCTVYGLARNIRSVAQVAAVLSLKDLSENGIIGSFKLEALNGSGKSVTGVELTPDKAHLRLDMLEHPSKRVVFITPKIVGHPSSNYTVEEIKIEPQTVVVDGPSSLLMNMVTLYTQPVDISDQKETFSRKVKLVIPSGLAVAEGSIVKINVKIIQTQQDYGNESSVEDAEGSE